MADHKDVSQVLADAGRRHIRNAGPVVQGFTTIVLDEDVRIPYERSQINEGVYFLRQAESAEDTGLTVHIIEFDQEGLASALEGGEKEIVARGNIKPLTDAQGREITLADLMAWYAIGDADSRDEARTIYESVYKTDEEQEQKERNPRARKTPYRRKSSGNAAPAAISMAVDSVTNALMGRNSGSIEPRAYFTDETAKIKSGAGFVLLDVKAGKDVDIDAAERAYRLNDRDRFWLDALYTIAMEEGKTEIAGSEILKLRGYANPYAKNSAATMADAAESIHKAINTEIAMDTTSEKRGTKRRGMKQTKRVTFRKVVLGDFSLDEYQKEGGGAPKTFRDFTVKLFAKPEISLPLAQYAKERGQLTTVVREDYTFTGISRITTDDRQMWAYVLRRIKAQRMSNVIRFDTMFRNLELREPNVSQYAYTNSKGQPLDKPLKDGGIVVDPSSAELASTELIETRQAEAARKQRERMIKKLEKMLDQKAGTCFKSWTWHKDARGRVDGVAIVRNESRES